MSDRRDQPCRTVRVADDEPSVRYVRSATTASAGRRSTDVESGSEAVERLRQQPLITDIVILDVNMPGGHVSEVLRELVTVRPDIRTILSSGYTRRWVADRYPELAPLEFTHKPCSLSTQVALIGDDRDALLGTLGQGRSMVV